MARLKLISATPSPYARKIRIALHEKNIPFDLITEVPWESTTQTPRYNPLEKLPVLLVTSSAGSNGDTANGDSTSGHSANGLGDLEGVKVEQAVYESSFILEWIEEKYPAEPKLYPSGSDEKSINERLLAKQIAVVADGMCDALVLRFFERAREERSRSNEWEARQLRKVDGGLRALAEWVGVGGAEKHFLVGGKFGVADLAAGSVLGYMNVRFPEHGWKEKYSGLRRYWEGLEQRESFKSSVPMAQIIREKIV